MKKTLAFMVMALALLLTQCRKPSIDFPTPSVTTTVSMTITAGPGSKTDITTEGGIVWSENDKIYVGDGSKYVGCLAIQSGVGNATGTFTGDVTVATGDDCTFHFYYLGHDNGVALADGATEATVDFSNQNIYADNGKLKNASGQHVGYGKAENVEVEADKPVMGLEVTMKSKVAIAYFCFQEVEGESVTPYKGTLTLSGDHIYNKMTVKFDASDFDFTPVKDGNISLTNTTTHLKYAMLVPTNSTAEEILNFSGGATGATALENGIEANKFYRIDGNMPIVVTIKPIEFSVAADVTVQFSPGNLQYLGKAEEGHKWRFAEHQWDYMGDGPLSSTDFRGNVDLSSLGYTTEQYNYGSGEDGGSETDKDKASARDLFGWGATGYKDTRAGTYQRNYQPYSTSNTQVTSGTAYSKNRYGYGPDYDGNKYGLTVEAKSDWGCVTGLPSAGEGKTWRTLSNDEWDYLMNTRTASTIGSTSDARYAEVKVNGVCGMMLFPDTFAWPSDVDTKPTTFNTNSTTWNGVDYSTAEFGKLESAGVVFLPAAGYRDGSSLSEVGSTGGYWSSPCYNSTLVYQLWFVSYQVDPREIKTRYYGYSVRLVR